MVVEHYCPDWDVSLISFNGKDWFIDTPKELHYIYYCPFCGVHLKDRYYGN